MRSFALWLGLLSLTLLPPAHAAGQERVIGVQPYQPTRALTERDYSLLETASPASAVNALISSQADMATATLASMSQVRGSDVEQVRIVQEITSVPLLYVVARVDMKPATRARLQRALHDSQIPQGGRMARAGKQDLVALDLHLDQTRNLLQAGALPSRPAQQAAR